MVTEEEYKKAKMIVEEYENQEYLDASMAAMYCVECQALEEHDCFCSDEEIVFCPICGQEEPYHSEDCKISYNL